MSHGDVRDFAADLYALYRAGRVLLPEIAATYESMTTDVHNTTGYVSSLFEGVDQGNTAQDYYSGTWLPAVEPAHRKIASNRRGHYDTLEVDMNALLEWARRNHTENVLIPKRPDIGERNEDDQLDPELDEFRNRDFHRNA